MVSVSRFLSKQVVVVELLSRADSFVTLQTVASQASLSMGLPRQEYRSGLSFPSPGDLPDPGIKPASLRSPVLAGRFFTTCATWEDLTNLLLLLLNHISHVRLCVTPQTAAYQTPPSLGFSRQEHWSGLPFPSPMHESESEVAQSCPTLRDPKDCSLPGSSIHGIFQARVLDLQRTFKILQ